MVYAWQLSIALLHYQTKGMFQKMVLNYVCFGYSYHLSLWREPKWERVHTRKMTSFICPCWGITEKSSWKCSKFCQRPSPNSCKFPDQLGLQQDEIAGARGRGCCNQLTDSRPDSWCILELPMEFMGTPTISHWWYHIAPLFPEASRAE